jgi:hypothetical protein
MDSSPTGFATEVTALPTSAVTLRESIAFLKNT